MARPPVRAPQGKTALLLEAAASRFRTAYAQGRFAEALAQCQQAMRLAPGLAVPVADAATCCVRLARWDEAISLAQRALTMGSTSLAPLDALAHAWGCKGDQAQMQRWGLAALQRREAMVGPDLPLAHQALPLPPPPTASRRASHLIAFSLFGAQAKYTECAVLNAQRQAQVYPHWRCCFFVDETVPPSVIERLQALDARIERMDPQEAQALPGPMWRFLALALPGVERVLFRDADSLINPREAAAVQAWIDAGRRFHVMRDAATHTELMLAGLWGAVAGALPPVRALLQHFLARPLASRHFADQLFLRACVWPYARGDLLQHDSVFGFAPCEHFPPVTLPHGEHVGDAEGSARLQLEASSWADGTPVQWSLWVPGASTPLCTYPGVVRQGEVSDIVPRCYARELQAGTLLARVQAQG